MRSISRRAVLLVPVAAGVALAGGGAAVDLGVLPGRTRLHTLLGLTGPDGAVPDVSPGPVLTGRLDDPAARLLAGGRDRPRSAGWLLALPPGPAAGRPLPVAVVLHGRGDDAGTAAALGYPQALAAAVGAGTPPFALAAVDGGDLYWHPRRTGADPQRLVTEHLLPLLAGRGLRCRTGDPVALAGWSMGGYGALLLAADLGVRRVAAVSAASPALWHRWQDSAPGAFDGPDDFRRHALWDRGRDLRGVDVRLDCGLDDPFAGATRDLAAALRAAGRPATTALAPGAHTWGYWRRVMVGELAWLGDRLAARHRRRPG